MKLAEVREKFPGVVRALEELQFDNNMAPPNEDTDYPPDAVVLMEKGEPFLASLTQDDLEEFVGGYSVEKVMMNYSEGKGPVEAADELLNGVLDGKWYNPEVG